ncbi:MAG: zinc ribbon domain-containing protein [Armatimonadetes bacterium]|nr:zinc ribbon domain-containing protein [Armatimonadota bacterium]MDW8121761.1 zinc ribbon domain-containing protein [Armatimonadota bacterium]
MPVKCPQCGTENLDGAFYCDECGASLQEAVPTEGPAPVPEEAPSPAPGEKRCPSCGHGNPADAQFCENCGATLAPEAAEPVPPAAPSPRLVVVPTGQEIPLDLSKGQVLIGRTDQVSRVFPDVDLTPYGGYDAGVSRRHCLITQTAGTFFVQDLDSTNGTKLNGSTLAPHQPQVIKDGDTLELGILQLVFRVQ